MDARHRGGAASSANGVPIRVKHHTGPKHTFATFLLTLLIFGLVTLVTLYPPSRSRHYRRIQRKITRPIYNLLSYAPIPSSLFAPTSDLAIALESLRAYPRVQGSAVVSSKWRSYNMMPAAHRRLGQSIGWTRALDRLEDCVEANSNVTDALAALGLAEAKRRGEPVSTLGGRLGGREDGRVVEVLKHFVRDWAAEGKSERDALFPLIIKALQTEHPNVGAQMSDSDRPRVLVPGCGLARLAYDIADQGFVVDANDFSYFMNISSSLIFSPEYTQRADQHSIHPYIHNPSHHRSLQSMTRAVTFPQILPTPEATSRLSFSRGDFMLLERPEAGGYDAIVTLFFIDTAQSLAALFAHIFSLLKPGGVWISLGPLLYFNSAMPLPLDSVLKLVQVSGFTLERTASHHDVAYTQDKEGMYSFKYDCEFWQARKPGGDEVAGKPAEPGESGIERAEQASKAKFKKQKEWAANQAENAGKAEADTAEVSSETREEL